MIPKICSLPASVSRFCHQSPNSSFVFYYLWLVWIFHSKFNHYHISTDIPSFVLFDTGIIYIINLIWFPATTFNVSPQYPSKYAQLGFIQLKPLISFSVLSIKNTYCQYVYHQHYLLHIFISKLTCYSSQYLWITFSARTLYLKIKVSLIALRSCPVSIREFYLLSSEVNNRFSSISDHFNFTVLSFLIVGYSEYNIYYLSMQTI